MSPPPEAPSDVEQWLQQQIAHLGPAGLGSLSLRRSPCTRKHCRACASGQQHRSHVLYVPVNGRRRALYVPEDLVAEVCECLANGRMLQELLYQAAVRYTQALKNHKAQTSTSNDE